MDLGTEHHKKKQQDIMCHPIKEHTTNYVFRLCGKTSSNQASGSPW